MSEYMSNHIIDFNGKASGDDLDDKTFEDWGALTVEQLTFGGGVHAKRHQAVGKQKDAQNVFEKQVDTRCYNRMTS